MDNVVNVRPPKATNVSLKYMKDTFVIHNGLLYDYYSIKTTTLIPGKIYSIDKTPPVLSEGYVCIEQEIYKVSVEDLLRRKVYVHKRYEQSVNSSTDTKPKPVQSSKQSKPNDNVGTEIDQNADVAWQEQIDSLLQNITAKTGEQWEVSYNP